MKLVVVKDKLREGFSLAERIASKSGSLPILGTIALTAQANFLELSATDLEIGVRYKFLAKNDEEGRVVIPAKSISQLLGFFSDPHITIQTTKGGLLLEDKQHQSTIKTMPPDDFPLIPELKEEARVFEVSPKLFCDSLSRVIGAASLHHAKPELTGVFFAFTQKKGEMVATDSFRLAVSNFSLEKEVGSPVSFILPQKAARELLAIFADKTEPLCVYFSPNQVAFAYSSKEDPSEPLIQIISRLIDGEYPPYQEVIPKTHQVKAQTRKSEFINHLKAASIFTNRLNEVRLNIDPKTRAIVFKARNDELGENVSFLPAAIEGQLQETSFNWRFLLDGASQIKSQDLEFLANGEDGPALLRGFDEQDFNYVVMPLRV